MGLLVELELNGAPITDFGFIHPARLSTLATLSLGQTRITAKGVRDLLPLK